MKCVVCVIASKIVEANADLKYQLALPIPILIYYIYLG